MTQRRCSAGARKKNTRTQTHTAIGEGFKTKKRGREGGKKEDFGARINECVHRVPAAPAAAARRLPGLFILHQQAMIYRPRENRRKALGVAEEMLLHSPRGYLYISISIYVYMYYVHVLLQVTPVFPHSSSSLYTHATPGLPSALFLLLFLSLSFLFEKHRL